MPNGGFGCAYCRFYTPGKCHLREAAITKDHWTVCANVTYLDSEPTSVRRFLGYRSLDVTGIEIKGSIFAITSDEGAYSQEPWLEKSEIFHEPSDMKCFVCAQLSPKTKRIKWRERDFFFCSYSHYHEWRNKTITLGEAKDEITAPLKNADFTQLDVIKENTTEEQRNRANELDTGKESGGHFFGVIGAIVSIKLAIYLWHLIFSK